jgi:hypothetical protein
MLAVEGVLKAICISSLSQILGRTPVREGHRRGIQVNGLLNAGHYI